MPLRYGLVLALLTSSFLEKTAAATEGESLPPHSILLGANAAFDSFDELPDLTRVFVDNGSEAPSEIGIVQFGRLFPGRVVGAPGSERFVPGLRSGAMFIPGNMRFDGHDLVFVPGVWENERFIPGIAAVPEFGFAAGQGFVAGTFHLDGLSSGPSSDEMREVLGQGRKRVVVETGSGYAFVEQEPVAGRRQPTLTGSGRFGIELGRLRDVTDGWNCTTPQPNSPGFSGWSSYGALVGTGLGGLALLFAPEAVGVGMLSDYLSVGGLLGGGVGLVS